MKTSPRVPFDCPSWISSVLASWKCRERYVIDGTRIDHVGGADKVNRIRCYSSAFMRRTAHLEVHVAVRADQEALVLEPPLEADIHELARELLHERLRVDGVDL
jgi:hypothetical protein